MLQPIFEDARKGSFAECGREEARAIQTMHAVLIALACLGLAAVMFCRLGQFPGLHGDEAWFGLAAQDMVLKGVPSFSGMTWYTGNLYPLAVAGVFSVIGDGVFELRAPGAALNATAVFVLAVTLARNFGFASAWLYLCLVGASLYWIWESRIAWEVTAFTLPLLSLLLANILHGFRSRATTAARPLLTDIAILSLCWIGALNHVIFMVVVIAFAGAAVGVAMLHPCRRRAELAVLMMCALSMTPLIFTRKMSIVQVLPAWQTSLLLLIVPPAIFGLLYALLRGAGAAIVQRFCEETRASPERGSRAETKIRLATALLLAPFVMFHGWAFAMAASGLGPAQRMAAVDPNMATKIIIIGLGLA